MGTRSQFLAFPLVASLALGACGTSGGEGPENDPISEQSVESHAQESPETTEEEETTSSELLPRAYDDVGGLVWAAVDGGYECGTFSRATDSVWGDSSGWCSASGESVFTVYSTESALKNQIDLWVQAQRGFSVLIGDRWTIRESKSTLNFLQAYLGGEIRIEEEGDPKSLSAQSVITPEDPDLTAIFSDWFDRVSGDHGRPMSVTGHRIGGDSDSIELWVQWLDTDWGQANQEARDAYESLGTSLALLAHYAGDPLETDIYNEQVAEVSNIKFFDYEGKFMGEWNPAFVALEE